MPNSKYIDRKPDMTVDWFEPTCRMVQHCLNDVEMLVALSPEQTRQMSEHLAACSECADLYEEFEEVDALIESLAQDPPAVLVEESIDEWNEAQRQEADRVSESVFHTAGEHGEEEGERDGNYDERVPELVGAGAFVSHMCHTVASDEMPQLAVTGPSHAGKAPSLLASGKRGRSPQYCRMEKSEHRETMFTIHGPENVLRAIIQLLRQALDHPFPEIGGGITFTWLLDSLLLNEAHPLWKDWNLAMRAALDVGWNVQQLVRPSSGINKVSRFTENMRNFLGTKGQYKPYMLPDSSQWTAPVNEADPPGLGIDFVLISDVGGLLVLAPDGKNVTACRLIPPGDQLVVTEMELQRGIAQANPIIAGVYQSPSNRYLVDMKDIDQHPGRRFTVINGLSESLVPDSIHEQRAYFLMGALGATRAQTDEVEEALGLEKERRDAMFHNLADYAQIDVCPLSAIDRLVRTGYYQTRDDWSARGAPALTPEQRRILLTSLISTLTTYPHYHLWVLTDPAAEDDITEFVVKEGYKAMTEFWVAEPPDESSRRDLAIVEPSIVQSLHSPEYWRQLKVHAICDRQEVLRLLEEKRSTVSE